MWGIRQRFLGFSEKSPPPTPTKAGPPPNEYEGEQCGNCKLLQRERNNLRGTQQSAFSKLVHVKSKWDPRLGAGGDGCLCVVLVVVGRGQSQPLISAVLLSPFAECCKHVAAPAVSETRIVMFEDHSAHGFKTTKWGVGPNY